MVAIKLIHELVEHSELYPELLDGLDWIVVPILNIDGYIYSHEVVSFLDEFCLIFSSIKEHKKKKNLTNEIQIMNTKEITMISRLQSFANLTFEIFGDFFRHFFLR